MDVEGSGRVNRIKEKGEEMYINKNPDYMAFLQDKEVYIFGAGEIGVRTAKILRRKRYDVSGFIDNNRSKIGTVIDGISVISLDEFIKLNSSSSFVIICGRQYEGEISEQLLRSNVYNFVCESDLEYGSGEEHYDEAYFTWQMPMGKFGAKVKKRLFQKYIKPDMSVLEFGAGSGYLLKELDAHEKLGIDINDSARDFMRTLGLESVKTISEVPNEWADVIISNSVLEHVENPLGSLRELRLKLKAGGKIIFYVPNESCETEYTPNNIDNHLYTWNCLNLGNLFKAAGYSICSVERIQEFWPDNYEVIAKEVSDTLFDFLAAVWGKATNANACLIVAKR